MICHAASLERFVPMNSHLPPSPMITMSLSLQMKLHDSAVTTIENTWTIHTSVQNARWKEKRPACLHTFEEAYKCFWLSEWFEWDWIVFVITLASWSIRTRNLLHSWMSIRTESIAFGRVFSRCLVVTNITEIASFIVRCSRCSQLGFVLVQAANRNDRTNHCLMGTFCSAWSYY